MSGAGTIVEQLRTLGPIPKTMRAGVYRDKGIVRVEEVPVPEVGDAEVLIKVAACGICGTDIKKIFYRYVEPPQILGHELAGTVVGVGRGVTKWKLGDRVMSFHHTPCGKCFYCERRMFSQCKLYKSTGLTAGFTPNGGGFGEYVKAMPWVAERGIVALPDNVSFEEATFIEPINTIVKAVQKARVAAGETVLIAGCGPIGLQLLMVAKVMGGRIYTSDPVATRRA
ncbi:MAG TPA: alcohol dehydrogenase catalytic domain-containing protein, partial [Candidatus Eisenbacteria bacterium]|nr:alcohol dehydrogenase catalytic domain-containing protein [Candidatus Eisenbacteria bacterium]